MIPSINYATLIEGRSIKFTYDILNKKVGNHELLLSSQCVYSNGLSPSI